jgi:propanediol dehydratase small subunit
METDSTAQYPLGAVSPDAIRTPGGLTVDELTLDALRAGALGSEEMRATPETLRRQSAIASAAGRRQLADNLARAAELATVADDVILAIYTALRPHRSTAQELRAWEQRLELEHNAPLTAAFVGEARTVYAERGLLAAESERTGTPTG